LLSSTHDLRKTKFDKQNPSTHCLRKMFTDVLKAHFFISCFLKINVVNTCVIWFWAVSSVGRASRLHRPSSNKLNLHLNKQSQQQ